MNAVKLGPGAKA